MMLSHSVATVCCTLVNLAKSSYSATSLMLACCAVPVEFADELCIAPVRQPMRLGVLQIRRYKYITGLYRAYALTVSSCSYMHASLQASAVLLPIRWALLSRFTFEGCRCSSAASAASCTSAAVLNMLPL